MALLALKNHKPLRETAGAFAFAQLYASTCTPAARPRNRRTWATFQPAVTGKATAAASDVEQREPTSWARGRALATIEVSMAYDNSDGRLRGRKLQAARLRIWSANPHCARCGKLVAFPGGFELDHITALHKDGSTNDDDNMQVLCVELRDGVKMGCHIDKTAEDMGYAKRAKFDAQGRVVW